MNYRRHYDLLIARAVGRNIDGYSERHHIVPRCLGGSDRKDNIVRLTPEEHFVAHQLLVKMNPDHAGLAGALFMMSRSAEGRTQRNNKVFGWMRRRYAEAKKGWMHEPAIRAEIAAKNRGKIRSAAFKAGVSEFHSGRKRPEETGRNISEAKKAKCNTPEFREKMRRIKLATPVSDEARANMSRAFTGRVHSEETKRKMSEAHMGRPKSPETRRRMSEARRRRQVNA